MGNKFKVLSIVLTIVALIMIGLGGYFIYDEFINKEDKEKNTTPIATSTPTPSAMPTTETSGYEFKDDLEKEIYEMIPQDCDEINSQNLDAFKNDVTLAKDINPEIKIAIVYRLLAKSEKNVSKFNKEKVDKIWKKIFNEDVNIKPGDYSTNSMCYSYNEDGSLSKGESCDGTCAENFKLEQIVKSGNTIEVKVRIEFFDYNTQKSYFDVDKTIPSTTDEFKYSYNYKFIFKKNKDGDYYFHSIEKGSDVLFEKKDPKCQECVIMYNVANSIHNGNITKKIYLNNEIKTLKVTIDSNEDELKENLEVDGKKIYTVEDAGHAGIERVLVINNEILMVTTHGSYVDSAGILFFDKDLNKLDVDLTLDEKYPNDMNISSFGGPGDGDGIKVEGNKIIIKGSRLIQTEYRCKYKGELLHATYEIEYLGNNKFSKAKQLEVLKIIDDDCWDE